MSFPGSPSANLPLVASQSPPEYELFNFPLAHSICLLTAYSESLRVFSLLFTLRRRRITLILVIADGIAKGAQNTLATSEICLSMMADFVIAPQGVQPHSYIGIGIVIIYPRFTPNSPIMVTLLSNARSNNTSSFSLSLNMATLWMPMT